MSTTAELTPMMQQYRNVKKQIPQAILFFRMGDFYEMFFEDAKTASRVLGLTLTARDSKKNKVPMCGVPHHASEGYIARLIKAGYKVAICDQTEDPKQAKGIVKRELTRIVTPGTVLDENLLSEKSNNYLVAVHRSGGLFGLSLLDLSTGEFKLTEISTIDELRNELTRLDPKEVLVSNMIEEDEMLSKYLRGVLPEARTVYEDWIFSYDHGYELLKEHFKTQSLDGFGCQGVIPGIAAAGAILHYLKENLHQSLKHIHHLSTYSNNAYVVLDVATQRNLELMQTQRGETGEGTLLWVLDATMTAMGGRLLRQWILHPLTSLEELTQRQTAVGELLEQRSALVEIREVLAEIKDLERLMGRLNCAGANGRDLVGLAASLGQIPQLREKLSPFKAPLLQKLIENLDPMPELRQKISQTLIDSPPITIQEGGCIREGVDAELDELRAISRDGKAWIARYQQQEIERTGIKSLKVRYNKVFGYYLEVSHANKELVPEDYIRKQTLVNAERYITPELKDYETKVMSAQEKSQIIEYKIFCDLRDQVLEQTEPVQKLARAVSEADVLGSLAWKGAEGDYVCPQLHEGTRLEITAGRHPVIEKMLSGEKFVPNDTLLDTEENQLAIITGPNMAGKSTYIRQVALLTLMAHIGSFIPAEKAQISIVDRVFTRVGASDELARGQSTFMVEMNEAANILNHATPKSLLILDEIGRGTSTFDGISLAWAIAEYLHNNPLVKAKTLFATHYHELTELEQIHEGVKNYNVSVKEWNDQVIFLRKIVPGGTDKSYGIHVARLAGLPQAVISRSLEILTNLEKGAIREDGKPTFAQDRGLKRDTDSNEQLFLFEQEDPPVVQKLREIDLNLLTPLEALNALNELKKEIK